MPDPFKGLADQASTTERYAKISCTVQQSLPYGELKVSFTLTVTCPQVKEAIDYAAEHLFAQATHYVNNGMQFLAPGIEPLKVLIPSR